MNQVLSILIPTIVSHKRTLDRQKFLARLMDAFALQKTERITIRPYPDDGTLTTGAKRQQLLEEADTPFVCFFDDDDLPSDDYCSSVLDAIDRGADVVGFRLHHYQDGELIGRSIISLGAEQWKTYNDPDGLLRYSRTPNHLSPIRREIALEIGFKALRVGEDADYSNRLYERYGGTMREVFVDKYLYNYYYRTRGPVPVVMYDEDGQLTREGMEAVIGAGGSVGWRGSVLTTLEQLEAVF